MLPAMPRDTPPQPAHQRAEGAAELGYAAAPQGARLKHLFQQAPLRFLFPDAEPGEPPTAALVNVAGGLAGGDAVRVAITLEAGTRATVTTPAAEKIYRSLGPQTGIASTLRLGEGARLEWLPQETILFNQARLRRALRVEMAPGAMLLGAEMLVLGRAARGETMQQGSLFDSWRIHGPSGLLWADALRLDGDIGARLASPFAIGGADAMGMLVLAGEGAEAQLPLLREVLEGRPGGATIPRPGLLLARLLGPGTVVREALGTAIRAMRHAAFGLPPRLPRLWTT